MTLAAKLVPIPDERYYWESRGLMSHIKKERKQHRLWHHVDNVHNTDWIDQANPSRYGRCQSHFKGIAFEDWRKIARSALEAEVSSIYHTTSKM